MSVTPPKYKLEQILMLAGQPFRVSGLLQIELPDGAAATRYLLQGDKGIAQILEERSGRLALLRQFPQTAAPDPSGREISVMGKRYALAGVDKLNIVGAEGASVGAAPAQGLLLSGKFESDAGLILREITPGGGAVQSFYAVKPVADGDIVTAEQHLKILEAQREAAEQEAAALAETSGSSSGWAVKLAGWTVSIIVIVVLVYACSSDDESSSSSARTGSVHYGGSGGK